MIVRKIGVQRMLETSAARRSIWETSPRPVGPRFLDIAIMVNVEKSIVGT
jgi:hypothetical protein